MFSCIRWKTKGVFMNKKTVLSLVLSGLIFSAGTAVASDIETPAQQLDPKISLSSNYSTQVFGDEMTITTKYTVKSKTSDEVNIKLLEASNKAKAQIEKFKESVKGDTSALEIQFSNVNIHPDYYYDKENNQQGKIVSWTGEAVLKLSVKNDFSLASKLASQLPDFVIVNVSYDLSKTEMKKYEDEAIKEAIDSFNRKSELITKSFGYTNFEIADVNVSFSGQNQIQPRIQYARAASSPLMLNAESDSMNTFDFTPNKFEISADISGQIKLTNK